MPIEIPSKDFLDDDDGITDPLIDSQKKHQLSLDAPTPTYIMMNNEEEQAAEKERDEQQHSISLEEHS